MIFSGLTLLSAVDCKYAVIANAEKKQLWASGGGLGPEAQSCQATLFGSQAKTQDQARLELSTFPQTQ
jgi:hypothetical protein